MELKSEDLIAAESTEGRAAGISKDSLLSGYLVALMSDDRLTEKIGRLREEVALDNEPRISRCT